MKLTPHEEKILELVQQHPEIVDNPDARKKIAEEQGLSEKTLRNRIADLKKYGVIELDRTTDYIISKEKKSANDMLVNIELFWKNRKLIFWNTFGFAVLSIIISLFLPKWYSSKAIIISSGGGQTNFLSMLSGLPIGDFGLSPLNTDISNYIAYLESRTILENIVNEFNLIERYKSKDVEYAIESLSNNIELKVGDEGALTLKVMDKNPVVARDMVNSFLRELDQMNRRISSEKGKFTRQFLEERLLRNKKELAKAEREFKDFQKYSGLMDIPSQVQALVDGYTHIYTQKVDAEIKLEVAQKTLTKNDPKLINLIYLVSALNDQLQSFIDKENDEKFRLQFSSLPDNTMKYARYYREVEIQNKILEIILPQYEQARMEETKNIPSIQIIDEPRIAINKIKPKRAYIVIGSTFMAFILSLVFIYIEYHTKNIRSYLKTLK